MSDIAKNDEWKSALRSYKQRYQKYDFQQVSILPWVGEHYYRKRILVLGESHYAAKGDRDEFGEWFTVHCWHNNRKGGPESSKFSRALIKKINHQLSWDDLAFYNFVQHIVLKKPRQRPRMEHICSPQTRNGFIEVLCALKPKKVLIVGKATWEWLPCHPTEDACLWANLSMPKRETRWQLPFRFSKNLAADDKVACWLSTGKKSKAIAAPIFHATGYPSGFADPSTKKTVDKLLNWPLSE